MDRLKRKRIYYVPGIISLAILPLFFILFAKKEIGEMTPVALRIFFADTNQAKLIPDVFERPYRSFPPKRNYVDVNFTGEDQNDKTKLDFAQIRIREILAQNDSKNGLHFKFGDSAKFGSFVGAVNVLGLEKAKTYLTQDQDLWFYHFPPDPKPDSNFYMDCGLERINLNTDETDSSNWAKGIKWASNIWNNSWEIIVAFFALLFSVFIFTRKRRNCE